MNVLTVNAGAVTLKLSVVDDHDRELAAAHADPWDELDASPFHDLRNQLAGAGGHVDAVGHRIVHGGERFVEPTLVDDEVESSLRDLAPLAPLHQERTLGALRLARAEFGHLPHIGCFDTSFHRTLSPIAYTYALPAAWRERWPLRRFGFHGLSHAQVARSAPAVARVDPNARIVSCHVGSGVSVCAIRDGCSIDTTMGFTPLEGAVMATRSGTIDPGILLWLTEHAGMTVAEVADALRTRSGLVGLCGGSGDMRDVVHRVAQGDEAASLAFEVYVHRLRAEIGAMAAALGGVDVLAFTGGVGQNLAAVRTALTAGLEYLGLAIDEQVNRAATSDAVISAAGATCAAVVISSAEHVAIARGTRDRLSSDER